jgi:hypothetical protein
MNRHYTNSLVFVIALFLSVPSFGQTPVKGKVTNSEDGSALPGVSIVIEGTTTGTVSDVDGNFTVNVPNSQSSLLFSFIGYTSQRIPVGSNTIINVIMEPDVSRLNEVIVTAFGISQEKKALGYAAQSVDASQITTMKQPNVVNALQGQVAGVQVTSSGGAPGMSSRIIIRGVNSLDPNADNQPLFEWSCNYYN